LDRAVKEYWKKYRATDKGKLAHKKSNFKHHLKSQFGISVETFESMRLLQGGKCAICKTKPTKRLHVDHDHDTGVVRSLLCMPCNTGLGMFRENPDRLDVAADYLRRWSGA
jgi:hypothetical protein